MDTKTKIHTQYSTRVRVQHENLEESRTHQSFRKEVNINNIVKRHVDQRIPLPTAGLVYSDVSGLTDYREALDNVQKVTKVFNRLPASSRGYFNNDAAEFLDWSLQNDAETVDGLIHGPPTPAPEASPPPPTDPPPEPEPTAPDPPPAA